MANRRKSRLSVLALLLSALLIATASAAIYYQITASMSFTATVSDVIFTSGDDTSACGGSIGTNATSVSFGSPYIPLAVEADVVITELVNVTNSDSSTHNVEFYLGATDENFGGELETLKIYVVAPNATEYLMIELDGSGAVTTNNQSVNIPASEEWAIKLVGHYDSGTLSTQSNTMTLRLQVTG